MDQHWRLTAWASVDGQTSIRYLPCGGGSVELVIGGDDGLNLLTTDAGLALLADVIEAARADRRRLHQLHHPECED